VSGSSRIGTPYLVRSIEPNPIASHDWHVQPVCQRSLWVPRLGGSLWIEAPARAGSVLELGALARIAAHLERLRHFCANLLRISNFSHSVKLNFVSSSAFALRELSNNAGELLSAIARIRRGGFAGDLSSPVLQWLLFSVGFPTGVRNYLVGPSEPASRFPRLGRPIGHREAPLLISISQRVA
jgi:hypothetical protein